MVDYKNLAIQLSVGIYLLEQYLCFRQHRKLLSVKKRTAELEQLLSEQEFKKTRAYALDKSSFGFISGLITQLIYWSMLYYEFIPYVWSVSADVLVKIGFTATAGTYFEVLQTLMYLSIFGIVNVLLTLPLSLYSTFVLEQKHGFNNQTLALFLSDIVKTLVLTAVIGYPFVALFIYLVRYTGDSFYMYVSPFVLLLQLFILTIYPTVIQPLFNKVEPLPEGSLRTAIEELASSVNFPLTKLFVIDGSKRSNHSNAYFYGFFNNKRIVLFDTLLEQVKETEDIVAVLAHEIGHWFHSHTLKMVVVGQVHLFIMFWFFSTMYKNAKMFTDFGFKINETPTGVEQFPIVISLLLFSYLYTPVEAVLSFGMNIMSRHFEFQADQYAAKRNMQQELISALLKLSVENKGVLWPDEWYSAWNHSHPPVLERIKALGGIKPKKNTSKESKSPMSTRDEKEKYLFDEVLKKQK